MSLSDVPNIPIRFLRLPEVLHRTGLGKTEIYAQVKLGTFPKPIAVTKTRVAWIESDVDAWLEKKVSDSRLQSAQILPIVRNNGPELIPPKRIGQSVMKTSTRKTTCTTVGDYVAQCQQGKDRGVALMAYMRANKAPCKLYHEIKSLMDSKAPEGVLVGLCHMVSVAATS